jgi:hypothetical protein
VFLNIWKDFTTSHTSKSRKGGIGQQANGVDKFYNYVILEGEFF